MNEFIEGFFLQASLILALGAQNIFVLESGLKKRHHLLVATLCSLCDTFLIMIGVMGAASIFVENPLLKCIFGLVGAVFLFYYGAIKLREGLIEPFDIETVVTTSYSTKQAIFLSLSFSLLNPHVYLDTVILIGGYSSKYESFSRLVFGAGASFFSVLWFFGLAIFSFWMREFLTKPESMKTVSLVSGTILLGLSFLLGLDIYEWIRLYFESQSPV